MLGMGYSGLADAGVYTHGAHEMFVVRSQWCPVGAGRLSQSQSIHYTIILAGIGMSFIQPELTHLHARSLQLPLLNLDARVRLLRTAMKGQGLSPRKLNSVLGHPALLASIQLTLGIPGLLSSLLYVLEKRLASTKKQ